MHAYAGSCHASRLNTGSQVSGLNTGSSCGDAIGKELEKLADRAGVIAGGPSSPSPQLHCGCCSSGHPGSVKATQLTTAGVPFLSALQGTWQISLHKRSGVTQPGRIQCSRVLACVTSPRSVYALP